MSSKRTSRKSHTPTVSTPTMSRPERPPSPLSPTLHSRTGEKMNLQNLNDRFAGYIEAVRYRDAQIRNLTEEKTTIEETHSQEIIQTKSFYDKELKMVRKALDNVSSDNSRNQLRADKAEKEGKEAKQELVSRTKDLEKLEREFKVLQQSYNDVSNRLNISDGELKTLKPEHAKLLKKLEDSKKNLELRDGYEKQLLENQKEFSDMYDVKIKKLQDKLDEAKMKNATSINDVREMTTKVSALTSRNVELEASNASLQKRMAELQKEMDDLSAHMRSEMARKDAEVKNKDEQMEAMTNDYKVLMETKVAIDMEIAAYRKLLEGEEARLGLSPSASPEVAGPSRGVKRKRTFIEEEDVFEMVSEHKGLGNVVIEPLEKGSKCIKVTNKGEGDINIGGWTLSNDSNGTDVAYKFHRTTTLKSGETCAVWSADAGQEHNPPNSLVMKKEGGWVIGAQNLTTLNNKEGEQEAERKSWEEKRQSSLHQSGHYRSRYLANEESKSCAIM